MVTMKLLLDIIYFKKVGHGMQHYSQYGEKLYCIYWYINVFLLFLLSLHVGGYSEKRVIKWAIIGVIGFAFLNKKIILDWNILILLFALVVYSFIFKYYFGDIDYFSWWNMEDVILPPILMYILCKQLVWKQSERRVEIIILVICLGTFFYSILNHTVYLQEGFLLGGRIWNDFWTHQPVYATEFSYWGVFIVGLLGYGIYCMHKRKWIQGITICLCVIIENYIHIIVGNRMVLMVTIVVAGINVLLYVFLNRKNRNKVRKVLYGAISILAIAVSIMAFNIGGIRNSTYMEQFFHRDGGILKNVRFQMIWEAILMLPSHWKGGGTMHAAGFNMVHNYWLQVANDTGIFPFVFWMAFNILGLAAIIRLIISPQISAKMKYMIVPVFGAIVSYLMMEIGGQGKSDYIIFYVMLISILNQTVENIKLKE